MVSALSALQVGSGFSAASAAWGSVASGGWDC